MQHTRRRNETPEESANASDEAGSIWDLTRNTQPWEMPLLGKTALRGERKQWHHAVLAAGCTQDTSLANERMHELARAGS
jgi:hypothetical protein